MGRKLELVTRFRELKVGPRVVAADGPWRRLREWG